MFQALGYPFHALAQHTIPTRNFWVLCRGHVEQDMPQDALQALDVALKHSISYRDEVKMFARAIFWRDPTKVRPKVGAEA